MGHRRPSPTCESSQLIRRAPFSRWQSTPVSHGGGQEQRQPLASSQVGPGVGSQPLHERACAPGTHMPGTCASVLCLFLRAVHTPVCTPARLSVHTDAHTSVHQTHHHAHTSCTHTPSRTHTHHTHMNSRAHMPSHTHALLHTHTRLYTLPCVHLAGGLEGPGTPLSWEEDRPPRTAGHQRTTPHAHGSWHQHPVQKTVLIRKSANGSLQLLIKSLIWDVFQGITE